MLRLMILLLAASSALWAQSDAEKFAEGRIAFDKYHDCAAARDALLAVSDRGREQPLWLFYMARTYECLNQPDKALPLYEKYSSLLPGQTPIIDKIGELRYTIRKRQEQQASDAQRQQQLDAALRISDPHQQVSTLEGLAGQFPQNVAVSKSLFDARLREKAMLTEAAKKKAAPVYEQIAAFIGSLGQVEFVDEDINAIASYKVSYASPCDPIQVHSSKRRAVGWSKYSYALWETDAEIRVTKLDDALTDDKLRLGLNNPRPGYRSACVPGLTVGYSGHVSSSTTIQTFYMASRNKVDHTDTETEVENHFTFCVSSDRPGDVDRLRNLLSIAQEACKDVSFR